MRISHPETLMEWGLFAKRNRGGTLRVKLTEMGTLDKLEVSKQSIRQMVHSLKSWLSGLKEKRAALLEVWEQAEGADHRRIYFRYMDLRSGNVPTGLPEES